MFRRKEEGSLDSSDASATPATSGSASTLSESSPVGASQLSSPVGAAASYSSPSSSQPPQMQPVVRTLSEAGRPATSVTPTAPAAGYRPVPVGDFNRGISRPGTPDVSRPGHAPLASPVANREGKPNPRILTVGNDILLKGEIATCDRIIIEGRVEAKLHDVHTVEIAVSGSFKGTAEVEEAEISGLFEGDLVVRQRLIIYSSGEVRGNITYGEIEIERGGRMTGQIKTITAGSASAGDKSSDKSNLLDVLDGKPSRGKDKDAA